MVVGGRAIGMHVEKDGGGGGRAGEGERLTCRIV